MTGGNSCNKEESILTPRLISLVEQIARKELKSSSTSVRQEQNWVVNGILYKIAKWATDHEPQDPEVLFRVAVKIAKNECTDLIRKARNWEKRFVPLTDCPADKAVAQSFIGNTAAEVHSVSFQAWSRFIKKLSFQQLASIFFQFKRDQINFLLYLVQEDLIDLKDLADRLRVNESELLELLESLPWEQENIEAFISERENRIRTNLNLTASRRDGRSKLKKMQKWLKII